MTRANHLVYKDGETHRHMHEHNVPHVHIGALYHNKEGGHDDTQTLVPGERK